MSIKEPAANGVFTIERVFEAPRERVFKAWSSADELAAWWGPKGCSVEVKRLEFRPGGFFHYAMRFPAGAIMWGRFLYREIAAGERIAWLNSFSNEECGITRAPFDAEIPLEILNEAVFSEVAEGTRLRVRAVPHGAPENERRTFAGMFASLNEGYGGTLDQLGAHLAR